MGLDEFLDALPEEADTPVNYASLPELSGLTTPESEEFGRLWLEWSDRRVLEIVNRMVMLGEDHTDVEFESIYKQGLIHTNDEVRLSSLKGLEESEDRTLIKPLGKMLNSDLSVHVRAAAAETLAHLSSMAQAGKLAPRDKKTLADTLYRVLEDESVNKTVRLKALESVAVFGGDRLTPHLEAAWSSGDMDARQSSIYAMGRTSDPKWAGYVIKDLDHDIVSLRYEAIMAIGEVGDERHLRALQISLDDADLTVQLAAISAVDRIGGDLAKTQLEQQLANPEPKVVELAQQALETMKEEEDLDKVVTPDMARSMFGASDTLPGIDTEGYEAAEIEGWAHINEDSSGGDDFGTGITEEAEELGLDRGDPFDIDLPPEDPWDHEENF